MWTGILVTLVALAGTFSLNEKEWEESVREMAANWTLSLYTTDEDEFWNLYSKDYIHFAPDRPVEYYQDRRQSISLSVANPYVYMANVELVYSNEDIAVSRDIVIAHPKNRYQFTVNGIYLFKIEDGEVKMWLHAFNRES